MAFFALFDQLLFVYDSVYHEEQDRANAKWDKLLARVAAYIVMMQQDRALSEINKHADLAKEVQKFATHGKRRCEIQKQGAGNAAENVDLSDCESGHIGDEEHQGRGKGEADGIYHQRESSRARFVLCIDAYRGNLWQQHTYGDHRGASYRSVDGTADKSRGEEQDANNDNARDVEGWSAFNFLQEEVEEG